MNKGTSVDSGTVMVGDGEEGLKSEFGKTRDWWWRMEKSKSDGTCRNEEKKTQSKKHVQQLQEQ